MAAQMLFYESAVPVSSGRHGKGSVEVGPRYSFSRTTNSVPLMAVEFAEAVAEYVIVFAPGGSGVVPVAVLGVSQAQNLYLTDADEWQARYVPAFVRRYPFVFAENPDGQTFTLCIDEAFPGLNYLGRGQALFDSQGQPTEYVQNVVKFQQEYRAQALRTEEFCKKLQSLDLLEPMQANFTLGGTDKMSLGGFLVINRTKLKSLDDVVLGELVRSDQLELIYLHLRSLRNFSLVTDRLAAIERQAEQVRPN